jgi:molybdopterin/thiamine biosynthesis adenylyltransferase
MDERHLRQIIIPDIGENGQSQLKRARVLVLGTGGLGGPALMYLAAAGVGTLHIVDEDVVALSNLNRQILFTEADIGRAKADCAASRLRAIDSALHIVPHRVRVHDDNARALIDGMDLVVDCVDNAPTRQVINRACVGLGIPFVEAGIGAWDGYVLPVVPKRSACFACATTGDNPRPPKGPLPVLGAAAGMIGAMQAGIAVRMLLGLSVPAGCRHVFSLVDLSCAAIPVPRDPRCPVCGTGASRNENADPKGAHC